MADDKKKPEGWNFTPVEMFILLLFLLAVVSSIVPMIWTYVTSQDFSFYGIRLSGIYDFFRRYAILFKILGFTIAGFAAIGTFTFTKKREAIWLAEKAKIYPAEMLTPSSKEPPKNPLSEKWEKIVKDSESENPSDWRIAVIEADIILDDLLTNLRLPGETMGDKLKAVEQSDFTTIEFAWEAHKARNMIAHEGSNFMINQREIRRIISLYEAVFKEFCLI